MQVFSVVEHIENEPNIGQASSSRAEHLWSRAVIRTRCPGSYCIDAQGGSDLIRSINSTGGQRRRQGSSLLLGLCVLLTIVLLTTSGGCVSETALEEGIPSQPRDLISSSGDEYVTLEWLSPESQGGSPVYAYEIYRGLSPDQMATMGTVGNVTSYNDNSVENGVTYHYKVRARNEQGWSNFSSLTNSTPYGTPDAPTGLQASTSGNQVNLLWVAPSDDGGLPIQNYRVYRGPSASQMSVLITIGNVTNYSDGSVSDGNTYFYRISAENMEGEGQYSSTIEVTLSGGGIDLTTTIIVVAVVAIAIVLVAFFLMRRR